MSRRKAIYRGLSKLERPNARKGARSYQVNMREAYRFETRKVMKGKKCRRIKFRRLVKLFEYLVCTQHGRVASW